MLEICLNIVDFPLVICEFIDSNLQFSIFCTSINSGSIKAKLVFFIKQMFKIVFKFGCLIRNFCYHKTSIPFVH